ncbi:hypothetical protein ACEWYA_07865 [Helicobacter pylori]|uniref:hypothetical protein n=1 Tax=Helicobacter pylori TaxID=210 RepID=UPI0035ABA5B1
MLIIQTQNLKGTDNLNRKIPLVANHLANPTRLASKSACNLGLQSNLNKTA